MADKYIEVANFRFGLDTRKSELTSNVGSLITCENGHINQGGEFEKRKKFALVGTLPTGCFGLQETSSAIYTFGNGASSIATLTRARASNVATLTFATSHGFSVGQLVTVASLGGTGYNAAGVTVATVPGPRSLTYANTGSDEGSTGDTAGRVTFPIGSPTGVSYQRLQHYNFWLGGQANLTLGDGSTLTPSSIDPSGGVLGATADFEPAMTAVLSSCAFKGNAVVIASFGAASAVGFPGTVHFAAATFPFYNGSPLVEYAVGKEWYGGDTNGTLLVGYQFALAMASYFGSDFTVNRVTSSGYNLTFTGPIGQAFELAINDSLGQATSVVQETASAAVTAVASRTTFYLTAGNSGSFTVCAGPNVVTGAVFGTLDLFQTETVAYASSLQVTAQNVAALINKYTGVTGYTAKASVDTTTSVVSITVVAPSTFGAIVNTQTLTVTTTGTMKLNLTAVAGGGAVGTLNPVLINGITASVARGQTQQIASGGSSAAGRTIEMVLTTNDLAYTLGYGAIGGVVPTFCYAQGQKLYLLYGNSFYFSDSNDPTKWEQQDAAAGTVEVSDLSASPTDLVALSHYQGKLAVFARRSTQIWAINADPALYAQGQIFTNIGTMAKLSVQSLGDLDVLFLSDTGIRSLRVRDSSLNAFVADIGSPIDSLIQAALLSAGSNTGACGVVEPTTNSYWLYLKGNIYVLSYYPSSKISAWSIYKPTYETTGATISPVDSSYSAGGTASYTGLTIGQTYLWTKGINDTSITNGVTTLTATGYFAATATTASAVGTALSVIGATLVNTPQTSFTPVKFLTYAGQVYVLADDGKVFQYGGSDNNSYDSCIPTGQTPFLDDKKPATDKFGQAINSALLGPWVLSMCADPKSNTYDTVWTGGSRTSPDTGGDSTFDTGKIAYESQGTHFAFKFVGQPAAIAMKVSSLIYHYNIADTP